MNPTTMVQGNINFDTARQRVNAAGQLAIADPDNGREVLDFNGIRQAKSPAEQASLLLKVVNDVAEALNAEVQETAKAKKYPYELSGYEISEAGVEAVEAGAEQLSGLLTSPLQALELSEKIKAHNPNTLPEAKVKAAPENSSSGNVEDAISAGERYIPEPDKALTLDNLDLTDEPQDWNVERLESSVGKVRTNIWLDNKMGVMIARDTTSALDIPGLCNIPGKGAMLTGITNHWLDTTFNKLAEEHGMTDHRVKGKENIDPNLTVVNKITPLPVEVVLRRYITGSADKAYQKGLRQFGSHRLPEGVKRNDRLDSVVVDPTIKGRDKDIRITDGVATNLVGFDDWNKIKTTATALFKAAEKTANDKGLILVDTKFEFGKTPEGKIVLIDEVLTPDSSRYWSTDNYKATMEANAEAKNPKDPEDYSKEPLRTWIKKRAVAEGFDPDDFKDNKEILRQKLGEVPEEVVTELAQKYATLYYALTGKEFAVDLQNKPDVNTRIQANLENAGLLRK